MNGPTGMTPGELAARSLSLCARMCLPCITGVLEPDQTVVTSTFTPRRRHIALSWPFKVCSFLEPSSFEFICRVPRGLEESCGGSEGIESLGSRVSRGLVARGGGRQGSQRRRLDCGLLRDREGGRKSRRNIMNSPTLRHFLRTHRLKRVR